MGVPWKGQEKNKIKGGGYLKRGAWIVLRFKRGLGEKEGVFLRGGGWYANANWLSLIITISLFHAECSQA